MVISWLYKEKEKTMECYLVHSKCCPFHNKNLLEFSENWMEKVCRRYILPVFLALAPLHWLRNNIFCSWCFTGIETLWFFFIVIYYCWLSFFFLSFLNTMSCRQKGTTYICYVVRICWININNTKFMCLSSA